MMTTNPVHNTAAHPEPIEGYCSKKSILRQAQYERKSNAINFQITKIAIVFVIALFSCSTMATTREWNFRVSLDKKEIGTHRYVLESDGDSRVLNSDASFDYKLLSFSVYRYVHHAEEVWQDDCIQQVNSTSVTNGTNESLKVYRVASGLFVDHHDRHATYEGCIKSFAYWNPDFLKETHLLNSQTGEYVSVSINKAGEESINVQGIPRIADHYQLRGPALSIDLWYVNGDWVALKALTDSGRILSYELR